MFCFKNISDCNLIKAKCSLYFKEYVISQKQFSTMKYVLELMPEIEKNLTSGEMKHRKHPGVRKMAPSKLPSFVKEAIYRLISNEHENSLIKESREMCKNLASRRLPVEMHEVEEKIYKSSSELNEIGEDIPEIIKKEKLQQLKKQIQLEIGRWKPLEYDQHECLTYLAGRAAPNYASTCRVFLEIKNKLPEFKPKSYFDFGSGIGSALWAAHSFWGDSIKEYFCTDSSAEMNDLSHNILTIENTDEMYITPVSYRQYLPVSPKIKYDLVVSAFSLMDLTCATERLHVIETLWRKTSDMLVIIEYGNLAGYSTVLDARDYILHVENGSTDENEMLKSPGAHVLCPCPHDASCPMTQKYRDPCGVFATYETIFPRQRTQFKNDWISYVVLKKGCRPQNDNKWPRIIKPVLKKSKHVHCRLCCKDGQIHEIIVSKSKQGRHAYRSARSSSLGDLLPVNVKEMSDGTDIDPENEILSSNEVFSNNCYLNSEDANHKT